MQVLAMHATISVIVDYTVMRIDQMVLFGQPPIQMQGQFRFAAQSHQVVGIFQGTRKAIQQDTFSGMIAHTSFHESHHYG